MRNKDPNKKLVFYKIYTKFDSRYLNLIIKFEKYYQDIDKGFCCMNSYQFKNL